MRVTQGCFSFLKDLSDDQISKQIEYAMGKGWAISIEWTDDPHPRNTYWELWGLPLFDIKDPAAVMYELNECRRISPNGYIKINAFDARLSEAINLFCRNLERLLQEIFTFHQTREAQISVSLGV